MVSQEPKKAIYGKNYKEERLYWTDKLSSWTEESTLALDYERPRTFTNETEVIELQIPDELRERLERVTGKLDFLLYAALLTLLKIHLHKWSGNHSIVIGSPARRRPDELVQRTNALAILDEVRGDQSVRQLLMQVRANLLEAYKRQDYPFEGLLRDLELDHIQNRCPLFDIALVLRNIHAPLPEVRNDMTISFSNNQDYLLGEIEFNPRLFARSTVERFANGYLQLMQRSLEDSSRLISDLPVLSEEERDQLLFEWNDTRTDYADDSCIHELFERKATTAPNATAVVFEGKRLTYSELDRRANQLARYLRSLGVGPEVVVGISLERSLEMIVGLLGILKAGGAYLPLDPSYPKDRLKLMLDRSGAAVLLTQQSLIEQFRGFGGVSIRLDAEREALEEQQADKPASGVTPDNLAYTIFTSGSTGEPKGVLLHHRGLCNLAQAQARVFRIDSESRVLQFASLNFDASIFEIVMAFHAGAALYVSKQESLLPGPELIRLLRDNAITTVTIPPSVLAALPDEKLPALRTIIVAGEACSAETLRRWKNGRTFFNAYGPTETTVWATVADCAHQQGRPDIGRPIVNTQAYILDEQLCLVRVGASGQLCIGGVGLARGYIGAPDLTAGGFVPDPFSGVPGARLYKTGDLARHLNDGRIEFLGRIDHQVKIRGFRIELHEVEAALSKHSAVREVAVISREDEPGDKRLVAYIVFRPGQAATSSELRGFLRESLPDYMLPSAFVILPRMPLLPNGKVNRRALPKPEATRPELEKGYVEPGTPVEKSLAEVWAQVLGLDKVGIHDSFLDLGGDSIRSIQVRALARKQGLDFSVQQLFRAQTIHELAREVTLEPERVLSGRVERFGLMSEEDRRELPADVEDAYPLTALQSGMIFFSEYNPESAIFHEILSVYLRTRLDVGVLRLALRQLFSRHPILRTSFDLRNFSQPLQLVRQEVDIPLYLDDLRHLGAAEQEDFITASIEQEKQRHIDLSSAPILRLQIHLRADDALQFTLSFHHAILDGWSVASMLTELFGTYFTMLRGQQRAVEYGPATSFSDYVALEIEAAKSDESRRYWTEKLDESTHTILPRWPYSRRAVRNRSIKILDVAISQAVSDRLWNLAKASSVPLKSLLLAAHLKTLSFITGQTDLTTGLTLHGRPEEVDGERVLGLFVIPAPLRIRLQGGSWLDLARACFDAEQELFPVRRFPVLELQRSLGRRGLLQPLFETAFNFAHFHVYQGIEESEEFQILDRSRFYEETDLTLLAQFSVDLASSQARLSLACNVGELTEEQAERIAVYYENALRAIAENPFARYETTSLLEGQERRRLLVEWNDTSADYPRDMCFHELIEAQERRTPDATAVVFEEQRLTYRELNGRANQLARHLGSLGVGPEVRVGILMEKSLEMVVAVFGVMKSGGAYVPLDPRYPVDRLAFMLKDSQAAVLLTQEALIEVLPEHQATVVCVNLDGDIFAQESDENLVGSVTSDNLAYVIFTSGSTGRPKGAMITHASLVNQTVAWQTAYDLRSVAGSHLQMASFSFDVFVGDVARALSTGAKLVLCPWHTLLVPDKLYALMRREEVDAAEFAPVVLRALLEYLKQTEQSLDFMRVLVVSSDAFYVSEYDEGHLFCGPGTRFINSYGLTEATIDSTFYEGGASDLPLDGLTPIGRPFSNTQVYTLDSCLQPTPVGVPGELCVGGDGLARGYLDRPELTADRFIPDQFGRPGGRLYKTGDQARFLPDGNIEMLGRIDHQVKIRGFRVELGEIESAIMQHPAVHQAVVLAREDSPGSKRLVAYLVPNPNQCQVQDGSQEADLEAERISQCQTVYDDEVLNYANNPLQATLVRKIVPQLRSSLKERLPDHMIPSAFVALERLPLTPNGKVNRSALPAPDQTRPDVDESFVEPVTTVEQGLARIWRQLFGLERISINDNFFELGGDSIAAIQVIARANKAGLHLSPRQVFQHQTIAELATVVSLAPPEAATDLGESRAPDVAGFSSDFPLAKLDQETLAGLMESNSPVDDIYPLSPLQQGMLFHALYEPESGVYVLQLRCAIEGELHVPALMEAWRQAIERHPVLRSQIEWEGLNEPVQIVKSGVNAPWDRLDWRGLSSADHEGRLGELLKADQRRGFDLTKAPLMRFTLIQTDDRCHQLIWSHHHVMVDGWSVGVILVEVFTSYEAIRRGVELKIERKRPYRDYIAWLQRQDLSKAEAAWRDSLKDFNTPTPLEIGRAPLNRAESDGYSDHRIWLPAGMTSALQSVARQHGLTLNTIVQGAWALLLSHYSGSRDVVFGAVVSGRPPLLAGFESMVGPFINSLPVRARLDDDAKLLIWLRTLQERQAAMREYEYTPLVQIKAWSEMPKAAPLFESLLSYENYTLDESLIKDQSELKFSGVQYSSTTNYPIAIRVLPGSEMSLVFLYDSRRFDSMSVIRVAEHLEALLAAFVSRPDVNLGSLKEALAEVSLRHRSEEEGELQKSAIDRLKSIRRRTVRSEQSKGV